MSLEHEAFASPTGLPPARAWQRAALARWLDHDLRGTVEVATGGGKTYFALQAYQAAAATKPLRLVIVVPTTALLDQWYLALIDDAAVPEESVRLLRGDDLELRTQYSLVIINTARKFAKAPGPHPDVMLVVDECHRAGSAENSKALLSEPGAALGLSATPYRDFDQGFEDRVAPVLGPVVFQYTVREAITDGVLAPLAMINVRVPLTEDEEREYSRLSRSIARAIAGDAEDERVEALLRQRARVYNSAYWRLPVMRQIMTSRRGHRALVFVESIAMAREAHSMLDQDGHSVTLYHSRMSTHIRQDNLRAFRKGIFDVLIAVRALDEGFNVPEAELAVVVSATASRRQRVQRVGRVLRPLQGKEQGDVITLYATPVEEQRLTAWAADLEGISEVRWSEAQVG